MQLRGPRQRNARILLVQAVARTVTGPCVVIGPDYAPVLVALCKGLWWRAGRRGKELNHVTVFTWQTNCAPFAANMDVLASNRRRLRNIWSVDWCKADDDLRTRWVERIREMRDDRVPYLRIVVHTGHGSVQDMAGDLKAMWPMMGPDTLVVLLKTHVTQPRALADRMRARFGWDAVDFGDVMLLQRPDHPKPPRQEGEES